MIRRVSAGFLSLLLVVGGLFAAPAPSVLAAGDQEYQGAALVLNRYGLVQGDQRGFRFGDAITRAEVAKLLVYSLGYGAQTEQYRGRRDFPDTAGHWGDGVIAVAKSLGVMRGYPEGDFRPENPVSYAEVVTALSRLVGLEPGAEAWPFTYVRPARAAGIVPADMALEGRLEQAAIRGDVFVLLKRTLADVKNVKGQTLLQLYLDKTPPDLTVDPLPTETQYAALPISGTAKDAAVVKINGVPVPVSDGYFRTDLPIIIGPNTIRVQALDDAGNLREETVQVKRLPGAPNSISLQGPASVKVRQVARFNVGLLDANGIDSADHSKIQADVSPADLGKFDPTTGTFTAGTKTGTAVITVQSGSAQNSLSVVVVAGPPDRISITPAEVSLAAGESVTFKASATDAFGNQVPLTDVQWSADGVTMGADGRFQAPASAGTGTYTVTAAAGGRTATAKVYPVNYQVASVRVSAPVATMRANGVSELALTATLLDSKGNPVTDYKGDLSVQTSDERVAEPVHRTVPVIGGMAQVPVRAGTLPGSVRITVGTNLNTVGFANLTTTAQKLQSVRLVGRAMPSTDGNPMGMVEAIALDQDGNVFRSPLGQTVVVEVTVKPDGTGPGTAWFVSTGTATANIALGDINPDTDDVRGQIMIQYTGGIGTVLIEGKAKPPSMQWVQILAGAIAGDQVGLPARLSIEPITDAQAGQPRSIYVNVLDANGYRVTRPGPLTGIVVSLRDQKGQVWTGAQSEPGRWRFDVTQSLSGTYIYTALLQPRGATASAVGTVHAGDLVSIKVLTPAVVIPADNRTDTVLKVELVDGNGNRLTAPPYLVTFRPDFDNNVTQIRNSQTVTSVNGVAQLRVTAGQVVGDQIFTVTAASTTNPSGPGLTTPVSITVSSQGVPERLEITYGDNDRNGVAGEDGDAVGRAGVPFIVAVKVADQYGTAVSYERSRSVKLTVQSVENPGRAPITQTVTAGAGWVTFSVNLGEAGTYAIKAESAGLMGGLTEGYGGSVRNATIAPSYHTGVKISIDDIQTLDLAHADSSYAWVKAELTDASGNVTSNQTSQDITVDLTLPNTKVGYFTIDNDYASPYRLSVRSVTIPAGASSSSAVKLFAIAAGTVSVQAETRDGLRSKAVTVTVTKLGPLVKLDVPARLTATPGAGTQVVEIIARDSANRRLTGLSDWVHVAVLSGGATIIGYLDETDTLVDSATGDMPIDRGRIKLLVSGEPGSLSALEAYLTIGAPASNGPLRPLFYIQF